MAYGTPSDPVGGTVITVAYAVANLLNPIRWLRAMTGNADPPGSDYVVVSTSTSATSWQKVGTDAIADDAITRAKLASGAVYRTEIADGAIIAQHIDPGAVGTNQLAIGAVGNNQLAIGAVGNNQLALGAVGANQLASNAVTTVKILDGAVEAVKLADGAVTTAKIGDGQVTAAKLASGVAAVPSGLVAAFRTAAEIASGWSRESNLDGRVMVGAGTTFSVTFTEDTAYGSSWSHTHTDSGHTHSGSDLSITGSTGGPSATDGIGNGGGTAAPTTNHTHDQGTLDVGGNTASGTASISSTAWTIPSRAYVFARKS